MLQFTPCSTLRCYLNMSPLLASQHVLLTHPSHRWSKKYPSTIRITCCPIMLYLVYVYVESICYCNYCLQLTRRNWFDRKNKLQHGLFFSFNLPQVGHDNSCGILITSNNTMPMISQCACFSLGWGLLLFPSIQCGWFGSCLASFSFLISCHNISSSIAYVNQKQNPCTWHKEHQFYSLLQISINYYISSQFTPMYENLKTFHSELTYKENVACTKLVKE